MAEEKGKFVWYVVWINHMFPVHTKGKRRNKMIEEFFFYDVMDV